MHFKYELALSNRVKKFSEASLYPIPENIDATSS